MTRGPVLWMFAVVTLAGCAPGVDVQRVSPRTVTAGAGETVRVIGAGFEYTYNTFSGEASAEFGVRLGNMPTVVEWVDATELLCTVPEDLAAGTYDVTVTVDDAEDVLADGLIIRATDS